MAGTDHDARLKAANPAAEPPHIQENFYRKYFVARIGSWFGVRPERMFRVDDVTPAGG